MKKRFAFRIVVCVAFLLLEQRSQAQLPILEAIRFAIDKVIKAIDLKVQRIQNKTIWLQNAQKTIENKMQELKLGEIKDWVEKQRELYAGYYDELWKVKKVIQYYEKVKAIIDKERALVQEYKNAYDLLRQDHHFTAQEIKQMGEVYAGILEKSGGNLEQLFVVVNSFTTQMSDGKRLELIDAASRTVDEQLTDLRQFTEQSIRLSLQRARDLREIERVKKIYGLL